MKTKIAFFMVFLSAKIFAQDFLLDSTVVNVSILTEDVNIPWDITWGPDHKIWMTDGPYIKKIDPKTGSTKTIWVSPRMTDGQPTDNGLGFAFHPNFIDTPQVFLALDTGFHYSKSGLIRIYRYDYSFKEEKLTNETLILEYKHGGEISGGRMLTIQDGHIMVTTADYRIGFPSSSLQGRTLRFKPDGSIPNDNPFNNYTFSYGHRNPQGICQIPNGNIIASEHGHGGKDELNLIQSGNNYGWPVYEADNCLGLFRDSCDSPTFMNTLPLSDGKNPPSGVEYYNHPGIPEFENSILEGVLSIGGGNGGINRFHLNHEGDSVVGKELFFRGEFLRIRDISVAPSGELYFISNDRENIDFESKPITSDAKIRRLKSKNFDHCTPTSSVVTHLICPGESVSIDGAGYSTAQNVTETLINSEGCDSLIIHVIEESPTIINKSIIVNENELTVQQNDAVYQWLECPNMDIIDDATDQSFSAENSGNYAVEITLDGCIDTSSCQSIIVTNAESLNKENVIDIYPNPTSGIIKFSEALNFRLFNLLGDLVLEGEGESLNIIGLSPGIYFLKSNLGSSKILLK